MDFVAVLDQVIALLRQRGRITYRTLQRQSQLDEVALEDLKAAAPAALGAAYTLTGRSADALALLTQTLEQSMATEMVLARCSLPLGEAHLLAGRFEEAQALAERALRFAQAHQERGNQAYALHLLGESAVRRDPPDVEPAESHYRQALALAEELGMRPLQAHCHRGLGTLYAQTGQREPARAALAAAIALYRDMEMTFWLPQAEAALAQVGEGEGSAGGMPCGVTP